MENIHIITITEEAIINAKGKKNSRHTIPVIGYKLDGTEVLRESSIEDAAHAIGAHPQYLGKCIINGSTCKGYKFIRADTMEANVDDMIDFFGKIAKRNAKDAKDAAKWREQEAAKEAARMAEEKRLADIAKAEEDRKKAIEKARAKVDRLSMEVERKYELYLAALEKHKNAAFELKELEDNANANNSTTEMEEAA